MNTLLIAEIYAAVTGILKITVYILVIMALVKYIRRKPKNHTIFPAE